MDTGTRHAIRPSLLLLLLTTWDEGETRGWIRKRKKRERGGWGQFPGPLPDPYSDMTFFPSLRGPAYILLGNYKGKRRRGNKGERSCCQAMPAKSNPFLRLFLWIDVSVQFCRSLHLVALFRKILLDKRDSISSRMPPAIFRPAKRTESKTGRDGLLARTLSDTWHVSRGETARIGWIRGKGFMQEKRNVFSFFPWIEVRIR